MSRAAMLRRGLEWSRDYLNFVLAKLSNDGYLNKTALTWQPVNGANSAGWLLVHLVACEDALIHSIIPGLRQYPFLADRFCMGAEPTADIPSFEEIRSMLDGTRRTALNVLDGLKEEDLDRVPASLADLPDSVTYIKPVNTWTGEHVFRGVMLHEWGHASQIAYLHNQIRMKFKASLPKDPSGRPKKKKTTIITPQDLGSLEVR